MLPVSRMVDSMEAHASHALREAFSTHAADHPAILDIGNVIRCAKSGRSLGRGPSFEAIAEEEEDSLRSGGARSSGPSGPMKSAEIDTGTDGAERQVSASSDEKWKRTTGVDWEFVSQLASGDAVPQTGADQGSGCA